MSPESGGQIISTTSYDKLIGRTPPDVTEVVENAVMRVIHDPDVDEDPEGVISAIIETECEALAAALREELEAVIYTTYDTPYDE